MDPFRFSFALQGDNFYWLNDVIYCRLTSLDQPSWISLLIFSQDNENLKKINAKPSQKANSM